MFSSLLKRNSLLFLAIFIPSIGLAGQYTPVDGSTSEENTDTLNRSLNDLYKTKLDVRPTNLLPLHTTSYMLGNTSYKWSGVFADSITVTNIYGLSSLSLSTITASSGTITKLSVTTITISNALVSQRHSVLLYNGNGHGSANTCVRRFTNSDVTGTNITYADASTTGGSITINETGFYYVSYSDRFTGGTFSIGISVGSTGLSTSIGSLTIGNGKLAIVQGNVTFAHCSVLRYFNAGDVIYAHDDTQCNDTTDNSIFFIQKLY